MAVASTPARGMIAVVAGLAVAGFAAAQEYPVKSIRVIAQFAAGSSTDTTARLIAQ